MAALNFPDPNVTTSYTNADTGISYEWSNNVWKAVRSAQTAPELFVNAAGDNVTGNLTFGTDKIVLNATTGAATFASAVEATEFTVNGSPIGGAGSQTLVSDTMPTPGDYEVGTMWWNSESSDTSLYVLYQDPTGPNGDAGGKYWIEASPAPDSIGFDGTHTGDSTFTGNMNVTGAGTFSGNVTSGSATGTASGWAVSNGYGVCNYVPNNDTFKSIYFNYGNGGIAIGDSNVTTDQNIYLNSDGSAEFAGGAVNIDSTAGWGDGLEYYRFDRYQFHSQYSNITAGGTAGSPLAVIRPDGSATFGGTVTAGDSVDSSTVWTGSGVTIYDAGVIYAGRSGSGNLWVGRQSGTPNNTSSISADGSATFANTLSVTGGGISLQYGPFELYAGNPFEKKISLNTDGSATFAGEIVSLSSNSTGNVTVGDLNYGGFDYKWAHISQNGSTVLSAIKPDGSATFAGRVTGKRLDIKGGEGGSPETCIAIYDNNGNENAFINAAGSAMFANQVVGDRFLANGDEITSFTAFTKNATGNLKRFTVYNTDTSSFAASIYGDGSAYFAGGSLDINQFGGVWAEGGVSVGGTDGANSNITLSGDGSVEFASGALTVNSNGRSFSKGPASGFHVNDIYGTNAAFAVSTSDGTNTFCTIMGDGSATFAGNVYVGGDITKPAEVGTLVAADGYIGVRRLSNQVAIQVKAKDNAAEYTAQINANGSAEFASGYCQFLANGAISNTVDDLSSQASVVSHRGFISGTVQGTMVYKNAGNLELRAGATDVKINLSGVDGSATFAGGQIVMNNDVITFGGTANKNIKLARDIGELGVSSDAAYRRVFHGMLNRSVTSEIKADGNATFAGNITAGNVSDIKFKENIEAAPAQLADIEAFELKTFDWKDEAPISDELKAQRKLGLIAQEVEAICPEMVYEVTGQDDDSYKAINHDVLIMKLLGAVKELAAKVAALEAS